MVDGKESSLFLERLPTPATGRPRLPGRNNGDAWFELAVVFTSCEATIAAVKMAATLATGLSARITLVVAQAVPYALPLEDPPVLLDFLRHRLGEIAGESPVETTICHFLCRDRLSTLSVVLKPGSVVVIGARKKWWPTREKTLARRLRRFGYDVILAETA